MANKLAYYQSMASAVSRDFEVNTNEVTNSFIGPNDEVSFTVSCSTMSSAANQSYAIGSWSTTSSGSRTMSFGVEKSASGYRYTAYAWTSEGMFETDNSGYVAYGPDLDELLITIRTEDNGSSFYHRLYANGNNLLLTNSNTFAGNRAPMAAWLDGVNVPFKAGVGLVTGFQSPWTYNGAPAGLKVYEVARHNGYLTGAQRTNLASAAADVESWGDYPHLWETSKAAMVT